MEILWIALRRDDHNRIGFGRWSVKLFKGCNFAVFWTPGALPLDQRKVLKELWVTPPASKCLLSSQRHFGKVSKCLRRVWECHPTRRIHQSWTVNIQIGNGNSEWRSGQCCCCCWRHHKCGGWQAVIVSEGVVEEGESFPMRLKRGTPKGLACVSHRSRRH